MELTNLNNGDLIWKCKGQINEWGNYQATQCIAAINNKSSITFKGCHYVPSHIVQNKLTEFIKLIKMVDF